MAGVSSKEIKNRIRSMESTKQITKAMEMVAASKLRKAQSQVQRSRPYFEILYSTINEIVASNSDFSSEYLVQRPVKKRCYVVIAGDRGLAGGYNSNVFKMVMNQITPEDVVVPVGKKALDFFRTKGYTCLTLNYAEAEKVSVGDCFSLAKNLCKQYMAGAYDELTVAYTDFVSVLSQVPNQRRLLPLVPEQTLPGVGSDILYEPDCQAVFGAIVPEYLGGVLYGALCESRASEQAARRGAMDSATQNAEEMIADLSLQYNRARQAAITQEITEIVAGSEQ
ncbi:MAG: ATP synthase F1 subunit gamma [Oscillospiraceae bacterium]|nr:ATP synthase F1 subunit gamma [Oscillospiraceae bacterium]